MISLLRRALASSPPSAAARWRRPLLAALLSPPPAPPGPARRAPELDPPPRRAFHASPRPLGFRATPASWDGSVPGAGGAAGEEDGGLEIAKLGISGRIVEKLTARGITRLFPIQRAVLEPAMQGKDMIGRARTGTGKTLAFGIPIMDRILTYNEKIGSSRNPLAIVLAPTRELARQVEKEFRESAPLDTLCVYGGVPINQQMRVLNYGVDIVVGTPGRVIDLLRRGVLNLSEIQFVVLDEADQMLAVGFDEDVEVIMEQLPQNRQSMLFSATMPSWIRKISNKYLKDPVIIDLVGDSDQKLPEGISLYSIASDSFGKPSILGPLIKLPKMPVTDEAADMFNVMRDNRSRSVGSRTGRSFGREGYGGFGDRRSGGFSDFDSFGGAFDRDGGSRDSGSRYRGGSGGFRRPSNDFGRSSFSRSDRFGDFGEGDFSRRGSADFGRSRSSDDSGSSCYGRGSSGFGSSDYG
nr:unnamed protein product [Digitaria exilis]